MECGRHAFGEIRAHRTGALRRDLRRLRERQSCRRSLPGLGVRHLPFVSGARAGAVTESQAPTGLPPSLPLRQRLPELLRRPLSRAYWWWHNRGQHVAAAWFSADRRRSVRSLSEVRGRHAGERCFIIGNGPSLKLTDLARLRGETTFGMNRIYLAFPDLGFATTYYVSVNSLVIEQCAHEIRQLTMPKFLAWRSRRWMTGDPGVVFLDADYTSPATFARDARQRIFEGSTVTYVALQLAYHMGFTEVVLIGVDHRFSTQEIGR